MDEIMVQEFTKKYTDDVIALILAIQQNEFKIPISKEEQPDLSNIENFYQTGNGNFWVALCNGQIVGTISLLDIGNQQAALRKMFVKAPFRGKNYNTAKLLLLQLITWAKKQSIQDIYLGTTDKFLAAHHFYAKNGFKQINQATLPSTFPIMKVDTKFYHYHL